MSVSADVELLDGIKKFTDLVVHVFHEGDVGGALDAELGFAFLHFIQPIFRWLDREMRGIVGEVQKEWLVFIGRLFLHIINGPLRENFRRMPLGLDDLLIERIQFTPPRSVSSNHPSCQREIREKIEATIVGDIG